MFYSGIADPAIEHDVKRIENLHRKFAESYADGRYLADDRLLLAALRDWNRLIREGTWKPVLYFGYRRSLNLVDKEAAANENRLINRLTAAANQTIFFPNSLARLPASKQRRLLGERKFSPFFYFLKKLFARGRHTLSDSEERILNLKILPAYHLWLAATERQIGSKTLRWRGREWTLAEVSGQLPFLPTAVRRSLGRRLMRVLKDNADCAENEINAVFIDKKINDELRGFASPPAATIFDYQNDQTVVQNLLNAVTKNFSISREFYEVKARLLGERRLTYHDRQARVRRIKKKFSFAEGLAILRRAFGAVSPVFAEITHRLAVNGQIDVYPRKGKMPGAYCAGGIATPTMVFLNYTGTIDDVLTFAHEMGHAIHTEFSKKQIPLYEDYSFTSAEIMSTLFENFVFDALTAELTTKEKLIILHDRLQDKISTIFRQIACFNFELELHSLVRESGFVPKEKIAALLNKHMKSYLGPAVDLTEDDGYFFVFWPHLRRYFYVYSYAYGELVSSFLYQRYRSTGDLSSIEKILSAGGCDSVENILTAAGVPVREPDFFSDAIEIIRQDLEKLKKLM